jgi:hypothetical protein
MTFTQEGMPRILGSGTAKVVITGDILDEKGDKIGELHRTASEAVADWEALLSDLGLRLQQ